MATKKKKQQKPNYLKTLALTLFFGAIVLSFYVWWNPSEARTMLANIISSFFGSYQPIFLFILVVVVILAFFYYLIKKPKISKQNMQKTGYFILILISLYWLNSSAHTLRSHNNAVDRNDYTMKVFRGTLISKDSDRAGIYEVKTNADTLKVHVGPASSCASEEPASSIKVGDLIEFQGISNGSKTYSVCEAGTYLKSLQNNY